MLAQRVEALEAARRPQPVTVARSGRRKRYLHIGAEEHLSRVRLFSHWQLLRRAQCGPRRQGRRAELKPWSVEGFSADVRDAQGFRFPARETWRWLADHNTHPPGGPWDRRITAAIKAAIADMIAAGVALSQGT
jgi:hypothetical protein